jgi:hypothetical protein
MDAAYLRSRLSYDAQTGVFTWLPKAVRPDFGRFDRTFAQKEKAAAAYAEAATRLFGEYARVA